MNLFSEPVSTRVAREVPAIFLPEIKKKKGSYGSNLNLHPSSGHGKMSPYLFCLAQILSHSISDTIQLKYQPGFSKWRNVYN